MLSAENLSVIESEGSRILDLARRDPGRSVPQYPDWTMRDLVSHTASIHGRTTLICEKQPSERISAPRLPAGLDELDWYGQTLELMLAALEKANPDTKVWGFGPDPTLGFWELRMVAETGVHRWDAEQAFGVETPLLDLVARVGLDEFGGMWLPGLPELPTLEVTATDLGESWVFGRREVSKIVEGSASDLYLRLMCRSGVELPPEWAAAVDGMAPAPKR